MSDSLLLEDERHLEELASDATEGPWVRWEGHSRVLCGNDGENTPSAIRGHGIAECDPGDLPDIKCNGELVEDNTVYEEQAEFNAEFIAAARLGIPLLLSRLKAEREKNQWIPVSERLPVFTKTWREGINEYKGSNRVWIFDGKWGECSGCLYGSGWTDSVGSTLTSVTHWMPLPEPPASKESHE